MRRAAVLSVDVIVVSHPVVRHGAVTNVTLHSLLKCRLIFDRHFYWHLTPQHLVALARLCVAPLQRVDDARCARKCLVLIAQHLRVVADKIEADVRVHVLVFNVCACATLHFRLGQHGLTVHIHPKGDWRLLLCEACEVFALLWQQLERFLGVKALVSGDVLVECALAFKALQAAHAGVN